MPSIELENLLEKSVRRSIVRVATAGSVDDGKSTFIGRLLYDCKGLYEDHIKAVERDSIINPEKLDFALLTDGLRAEREQGITIDVAYRYFSTLNRHFILADSPGHEQYTRNMATGASTANIGILLIDARHGVTTQTRRHAFITSLLGVPRIVVAVNKMDLVDWSEKVFSEIKEDFLALAHKLSIQEIKFIPVSALLGDNIVRSSEEMPWYEGSSVLNYLEQAYVDSDSNVIDFRFPVQYVIRPDQSFRGFAGQIASGSINVGEEVVVVPSGRSAKVKSIQTFDGELGEAFAPQSVVLTLDKEIDISRGDMLVRTQNRPRVVSEFEAMIVGMAETPLLPSQNYVLKHTTRELKCKISDIQYVVDVDTLNRKDAQAVHLNDIARVRIALNQKIATDSYADNRTTGSFVLIDEIQNSTLGAGTIINRLPDASKSSGPTEVVSQNIRREKGLVSTAERENRQKQKGMTLWFTGLPSSGKSTLAISLERRLFDAGINVYRLDGDNVRHGLCRDLGFSEKDRSENIRRISEVARLFSEAGTVVLCSFISPLESDRALAREIIGCERFHEVFVDAPIELCEMRDPKGHYKKAKEGEITGFTGVSAPYEAPKSPDSQLKTGELSVEQATQQLYKVVRQRVKL